MNIFVLDNDPVKAAQFHCDKHVVKMILESAQLLSTAHRVLDGTPCIRLSATGRKMQSFSMGTPDLDSTLYQATHINHPCAIWVRQSGANYQWLYELFNALCNEYTRRYKKTHLTELKLSALLWLEPTNIPVGPRTPFAQAMPEQYQQSDAVEAYRNYYIHEKSDIAVWNYSTKPYWYTK